MNRTRAFTLIELLIVVAIIAILAAIAVPNFLEAQTRSKVSRVKADLRSLGVALEAYRVDANAYPPTLTPGGSGERSIDDPANLVALSTPVEYISNPHLRDPFKLYPPGTNPHTTNPQLYLTFIYIPFQRQIDDWANNVDDKFRRAAAFPRVNAFDLGYGPPADAKKFPGPYSWVLASYGPDFSLQFDNSWTGNPYGIDAYMPYDPTNGTISWGDIYRFGGE